MGARLTFLMAPVSHVACAVVKQDAPVLIHRDIPNHTKIYQKTTTCLKGWEMIEEVLPLYLDLLL